MTNRRITPNKYLNHVVIKKEDYTRDSSDIVKILRGKLFRREGFFNNGAYDDSTQILIDSIIYSPDFKKFAVFVMIKNPVARQLSPNPDYEWYYDGTCFLGVRKSDSIYMDYVGSSFTNSYNKAELSGMMRDEYLSSFATKDTVGLNTYRCNMNDIRFWDCSIWREMETNALKRKIFEEEKKKHPENVYDPRHS